MFACSWFSVFSIVPSHTTMTTTLTPKFAADSPEADGPFRLLALAHGLGSQTRSWERDVRCGRIRFQVMSVISVALMWGPAWYCWSLRMCQGRVSFFTSTIFNQQPDVDVCGIRQKECLDTHGLAKCEVLGSPRSPAQSKIDLCLFEDLKESLSLFWTYPGGFWISMDFSSGG